jgi:predicted ATP-grasp superfamily ATP-dependent carboligase
MKALVTDASLDFTVDIVRCLGKEGVDVLAVGGPDTSGLDPAFHSRYCKEEFMGPHPTAKEYIEFLTQTIRDRKIDVLIPVGCRSTETIARNRKRLEKITHFEIANWESIQVASSKKKTYELARELGIPYPTTIYPRNLREMHESSKTLRYPVVIKPINEGLGRPIYPRNPQELVEKYIAFCSKHSLSEADYPMIQEYIASESTHSFSALYQNGVCKRIFMWNEKRSSPISGGASTFSESIYDPKLKELGTKLLDKLTWHGVANIEFKRDKKDKQFKLMEINPRFWASIDIALQCGVDFPYLLCRMAKGTQLDYSEEYTRNLKFHWLYREMAYAIRQPQAIPRIVADTFDPNVKSDVQLTDFGPYFFLFALRLAKRIRSRPHKNDLEKPEITKT